MSNKIKRANKKAMVDQEEATMMQVSQTFFKGPLPQPEQLIRYNEACENAADRIIKMAETQALHRQELEKISIRSQSRNSLLGLLCGFIIGMTAIEVEEER